MFTAKLENLKRKTNKEEIVLIIKEDDILDILKKLIELKLNKVLFIKNYEDGNSRKWTISLKLNEIEYETIISELANYEIYSVEEDRFGKLFEKRLGA